MIYRRGLAREDFMKDTFTVHLESKFETLEGESYGEATGFTASIPFTMCAYLKEYPDVFERLEGDSSIVESLKNEEIRKFINEMNLPLEISGRFGSVNSGLVNGQNYARFSNS